MSAISFHRCELWDLACDKMADFCTAWRKGVRRKRNIPSDTHCYILPLLCECLPVYDEVCRRSINFLRTCVSHRSKVVRCVANYGIFVWTMWLLLHTLRCMNQYSATQSFVPDVWEPCLRECRKRHFYSAGTIGWPVAQMHYDSIMTMFLL